MGEGSGCLWAALALAVLGSVPRGDARNYTVEQKIRDDSDLSQFYSLLENSPEANLTLWFRQVTVFVPTNQAFQKRPVKDRADSVLYHMTNLALTLDELQSSVFSELEGNPPLWITKRRGQHRDDIYVNNARVIPERSNYVQHNHNGRKQVLHVIDEVLEPLLPFAKDGAQVYNPDAYQFLNQSENLDLESHRVRSFRQRVNMNGKEHIFKREGRFTFFIPVDEGFKPPPRPEKIDQKVIDGHVIPDHVLFTDGTPKDHDYRTLAFGDSLRVTVSFTTQSDGRVSRPYVKSNTIVGDASHATGVVLAEIVKANIPVKNGVVHLIHRPLMVVDTTVQQFLEEKEDGPLYKFYEVILDAGGDFMNKITTMRDLTLFAPSNEAWSDKELANLFGNREKLREILDLHLVPDRLKVDRIIEQNVNQLFQVPTAAARRHLYFNVLRGDNNVTLTVEGGGVNATVVQPDIAATNGIVHIIDRVLGVPYATVKEKLATDPMLSQTNYLGARGGFNDQLDDKTKRFTYFVPRDLAWTRAELHFPSTYKKLFMKEYSYHARQILERHLLVGDTAYTMAALKRMTNQSLYLPSVRDQVRLRVRENDKGYMVEWQNEWIHVFRPDVECTNGVIHVIDAVFLKASDVQVTGGAGALAPRLAALVTAVAMRLVL
ncbi:fasciclin-1 isoform X2 [Bacillus rossius redtenbacheri]|uniref:fasciclin-1 isoform X2 n=1 Tax=Bacillus rossius redtenbacheri TaxID=93214 RepID=UPI002FDE8380